MVGNVIIITILVLIVLGIFKIILFGLCGMSFGEMIEYDMRVETKDKVFKEFLTDKKIRDEINKRDKK